MLMSLLIKNIGELFDGRRINRNTCIYVEDGIIKSIGKEEEADEIIDAKGKFVMPGFVDCHTHAIFSGYRDFELEWKIDGISYKEIAERGGGIGYTVEQTKKASKERLLRETMKRVKEMIKHGTTTAEMKSGYGLDLENEIKMLEVINKIDKIDVIPTFLVHAIPAGKNADEYIEEVIGEIIPEIARRKLAKFIDIFCEEGYFNVKQSERVLVEGKKYGMTPKIHADEFSCIGCSELAAEIYAVSADHLLMTDEKSMEKMAKAGVIATLLPAVPFVLNTPYPNARKMMKAGLKIALATDLNPNCYVTNMQFIVQLACYKMKMKPIEALKAATLNAAKAIKMDHLVGSIEEGKKADLLIMDSPSHSFIAYEIGRNMVSTVIKSGKIIWQSEE